MILHIFFLMTFNTVAVATDDSNLLELFEVLRENRAITKAQYEELNILAGDDPARQHNAKHDANMLDSEVQVSTKGGLEVSDTDGEFSFKLGGRIMIDTAWYQEDKNKLGDGTELRRLRLGAEGVLFNDWAYKLSLDFANGDVDVKDAIIRYNGFNPVKITVGHFKEPFSLEEQTSSNYFTFMERAIPNAFSPDRAIGIEARSHGKIWTAAGGLFGEAFDDYVDNESSESWAATGRFTLVPWLEKTRVLHFGSAFTHRLVNNKGEVKFNIRPESHITDVKYLNTDDIADVSSITGAGFEAAGVIGPWSLQAEYIYAGLNRDGNMEDLAFDGWYLYGSWFLTGESRKYKFEKGGFGKVKPHHNYGAWEMAIRYSTLDLNDGLVTGGDSNIWTLGLNWYINSQLRVMANYSFVNNDINANDNGSLAGNDNPQLFQMRVQAYF